MEKPNIPIFYACDERFLKFTIVSIHSLIQNASQDYTYTIYILHSDISKEAQQQTKPLETENVRIVYSDVTERLKDINSNLPLRPTSVCSSRICIRS